MSPWHWHWLWMGASALLFAVFVTIYRRQTVHISQLRTEADQVTRLVETVDGQDWQGSLQRLLEAVGKIGLGRSASISTEQPLDFDASDGTNYLPLIGGAERIGLLVIEGVAPGTNPSDSQPLRVLQALFGLALTSMRLHHKQVALSSTDGLTGLSNHRHFQQALGVMVAQAYLEGVGLAVILLDIDHFKSVNDTHGHLFGDLVLREIGYLLRRSLPESGLAARYGGEEMVVLLKGSDAQRAPELAEQIRAAIAEHEILDYNAGNRLQVTVSLGVACYELGQGKNRLIARADEALYCSKRQGRNRVTVG
jgi:diguanylate cyclase (GGDEF)-like protein